MTNDQTRMTRECPMTECSDRSPKTGRFLVIENWSFNGHSGLVIGHFRGYDFGQLIVA
jgi:hypothetical protein